MFALCQAIVEPMMVIYELVMIVMVADRFMEVPQGDTVILLGILASFVSLMIFAAFGLSIAYGVEWL